jgi:hypothetical protein
LHERIVGRGWRGMRRRGAVAVLVGACAVAALGAIELGCLRCCDEDVCDYGPDSTLEIAVGPQFGTVEITTEGASCSPVRDVRTTERGNRIWQAQMTRIDAPCTVTAVLDGVTYRETVVSGESCGAPAPQFVSFGVSYD